MSSAPVRGTPRTSDAQAAHEAAEQSVGPAQRRAILERDNAQCRHCGTGGDNRLQLHHVILRSQGGEDTAENLVTLCAWCHMALHAGKYHLVVFVIRGVLQVFCTRPEITGRIRRVQPFNPAQPYARRIHVS